MDWGSYGVKMGAGGRLAVRPFFIPRDPANPARAGVRRGSYTGTHHWYKGRRKGTPYKPSRLDAHTAYLASRACHC
jgi:hypothetical protein